MKKLSGGIDHRKPQPKFHQNRMGRLGVVSFFLTLVAFYNTVFGLHSHVHEDVSVSASRSRSEARSVGGEGSLHASPPSSLSSSPPFTSATLFSLVYFFLVFFSYSFCFLSFLSAPVIHSHSIVYKYYFFIHLNKTFFKV